MYHVMYNESCYVPYIMLFAMYNVIYHASCYLPYIMLFTMYHVILHIFFTFAQKFMYFS